MPPRGAVAAAAAPGGAAANGGQQQQQGAGGILQLVMRIGMMYYMFNMFKGGSQMGPGAGGAAGSGAAAMLKPLHARGTPFDIRFVLSETPDLASLGDGTLIWQQNDVGIGTTSERKFTYMYTPSEVRNVEDNCAGVPGTLGGGRRGAGSCERLCVCARATEPF